LGEEEGGGLCGVVGFDLKVGCALVACVEGSAESWILALFLESLLWSKEVACRCPKEPASCAESEEGTWFALAWKADAEEVACLESISLCQRTVGQPDAVAEVLVPV
jgi:hypothetical protein